MADRSAKEESPFIAGVVEDANTSNKNSCYTGDESGASDRDLLAQHRREESIMFYRIKKYASYLFAVLACAYVCIYLFNLLAPQWLRWLTAEDLSDMREVVVSILAGVLSSIVSGYFWHRREH